MTASRLGHFNGPSPTFFAYIRSFQTPFVPKRFQTSVGFKLRSSEQKASKMTRYHHGRLKENFLNAPFPASFSSFQQITENRFIIKFCRCQAGFELWTSGVRQRRLCHLSHKHCPQDEIFNKPNHFISHNLLFSSAAIHSPSSHLFLHLNLFITSRPGKSCILKYPILN